MHNNRKTSCALFMREYKTRERSQSNAELLAVARWYITVDIVSAEAMGNI